MLEGGSIKCKLQKIFKGTQTAWNKFLKPALNMASPNCPSCKRNNWLEFDKGYYCKNCEYIIKKQKHQIDKKILRQDRDFSTRINYAV